MKRNTLEMLGLAGLVASLVITTAGCTPVRRGSANLRDKTPENDRVLPSGCEGETAGDVVLKTPDEAKPLPYWKQREQGLVEEAAPAPAAVKAAAPAGYTSYTVKKDESLSKIAYRYGLRWQDVAAANPGLNPNKLKVGQVISLPGAVDTSKSAAKDKKTEPAAPAGATVYTVQKGDYIGKIAGKFHVRSSAIREANNLKNDKILAGQKLIIPARGAEVKAQAKPAPVVEAKAQPKPEVKPAVQKKEPAPVAVPDPVLPKMEVVPAESPAVSDMPSMDIPSVTVPEADVVPAPAVNVSSAVVAPASASTHIANGEEDLFAIAVRWGTSAEAIKKANNLGDDAVGLLPKGTVLTIPALPSK